MENIGNTAIISVGVGQWYAQGIDRLERSLLFHGYPGKIITWKECYPPNSPTNEENPYAFKLYAFDEAIKLGIRHTLFVDSSFWAVANPSPIFDLINEHGIFAFRTG